MKLLLCMECQDIIRLIEDDLRFCKCGLCCGMYLDERQVVTNGNGTSLAIGNGSLVQAIGANFLEKGDTKFIAWVRPNEGLKNPNSRVDRQLGFSKGD